MHTFRKPRIALAGVMCTPFQGDKENNYASDRAQMEQLTESLGFELFAYEKGLYSKEDTLEAAQKIKEWQADFLLLQTSSFAAGDFIYSFTDGPWRLGLWAVPEGPPGPKGGLPLNSFTGANLYNSIIRTRTDLTPPAVKWFFGHPGQPFFDTRLKVTVEALRPMVNLPGKKVALIGGVAPGFDNLIVDPDLVQERMGIEILEIDLAEVIQYARDLGDDRIEPVAEDLRSSAKTLAENPGQALGKSARIVVALNDLAEKRQFDAVALSCWPQFQEDYQLAVCSVMGHLNGLGLIAACEGDVTSAISMMLLQMISGGDVVTLMDLATIDPSDESILLWHCGPTSPALADKNGVTMQSLWLFDSEDGEVTGLHNDMVLKRGRASVLGLTTDFNHMLILEGDIDPSKASYKGSRGWFKNLQINGQQISTSVLAQTLMTSGYQHHYPLGYGVWTEAALEYCHWQGIQPLAPVPYTTYVK
jgi:hypothetical protein